jgi:hypothetical protein
MTMRGLSIGRPARVLVALLALALSVSCDRVATQVLVRVEADPETRDGTFSVVARVWNQENQLRLERTLALRGDPPEATFPMTIPLVPEGGDADRSFRCEVQALDATDTPFNTARAVSTYVADRLFEVRVRLYDPCRRIDCPDDQTCREGVCVDARVEPTPVGVVPAGLGWHELPDTRIEGVCQDDGELHGVTGCSWATSGYSSAIADLEHNRMLIWGGGFNQYHGNAVFELALEDLTMRELTSPSRPVTPCAIDALPDERPVARDIYGGLAFVEHARRMYMRGGYGDPRCTEWVTGTWLFDPDGGEWARRAPTVAPTAPISIAVYDAALRRVLIHDLSTLWAYSLETDTYTSLRSEVLVDYHSSGEIDPERHLFVLAGAGRFHVIDVSEGSDHAMTSSAAPPGCEALIAGAYPALSYDPIERRIVGWAGGDTVLLLDPSAATCEARVFPGGPGAAEDGGTHGRMRYFPSLDAHVLVNRASQNAFALRIR